MTADALSPKNTRQPGHIVLALMTAALFAALTLTRFNFIVDDAYIHFRYARNIANGVGPVFNPGERVEGYSSPIWPFILAAGSKAGLDIVLLAKLIGVACGAAAVLIVSLFGHRLLQAPPSVGIVAGLLLAVDTPWVICSNNGLETSLFFLVSSVVMLVYAAEVQRGRLAWSGFLFALLVLVRPEGALFATGAIGVTCLLKGVRREWCIRKDELISALIFLGIVGAHLAWRHHYYHYFLPNTYYAKGNVGKGFDANSLKFLIGRRMVYLLGYFVFCHACLPLIGLAGIGAALLQRSSRMGMFLALPFLCSPFLFTWQSYGDWMPGYRFLSPILPILCLGIAFLCLRRRPEAEHEKPRMRVWAAASAILVLGAASAYHMHVWPYLFFDGGQNTYGCDFKRDYGWYPEMAAWCKQHIPRNSLVSTFAIGHLGYECGFRMLDIGGLIDPYLARIKADLNRKIDLGYILGRKPDYMLMINLASDEERQHGIFHAQLTTDERMFRDLRFRATYRHVASLPYPPKGLEVFERSNDLLLDVFRDWDRVIVSKQEDRNPLTPIRSLDGFWLTPDSMGRDVISAPPPSCFYVPVYLNQPATLHFGYAVHPNVWGYDDHLGRSDGTEFYIDIISAQGAKRVFHSQIDPQHNPEQRHWFDEIADVSKWAGQTILIAFGTTHGENDLSDWGLWTSPCLVARPSISPTCSQKAE